MTLEQLIDKANRIKEKYGNLEVKVQHGAGYVDTDLCLVEFGGTVYAIIDYGSGMEYDPEIAD